MPAHPANPNRESRNALVHGLALDTHETRPARRLPHERLDVFQVAIELVELVASQRTVRGAAHVFDQVKRASTSVALNIAEGCGKDGKDRARFFSIARGSALETAAGLRVLLALGAIPNAKHHQGRALCERLYAMLTKLTRS